MLPFWSCTRLGSKSVIGELCHWSAAGVTQPVQRTANLTVARGQGSRSQYCEYRWRGDGGCLVHNVGRNNAQLLLLALASKRRSVQVCLCLLKQARWWLTSPIRDRHIQLQRLQGGAQLESCFSVGLSFPLRLLCGWPRKCCLPSGWCFSTGHGPQPSWSSGESRCRSRQETF